VRNYIDAVNIAKMKKDYYPLLSTQQIRMQIESMAAPPTAPTPQAIQSIVKQVRIGKHHVEFMAHTAFRCEKFVSQVAPAAIIDVQNQ
jgi:hypothetical protein